MGVCSALFELGGMTVMHDASGCNSTYTTHDEPRWYDMDSMVYISGISEMEAIMGDDEKLIGDIVDAATELKPAFIAIAGTPIPAMTGFDFEAVAEVIEHRTGIPCFGFPTTGMNTYVQGVSMALKGLAERFASHGNDIEDNPVKERSKSNAHEAGGKYKVNVLGLTPLDFSTNGTDDSICKWMDGNGFEAVSRWAMGSSLQEIAMAGSADVNLVVSASGLAAAKVLRERFGTPYVIGLPYGDEFSGLLKELLEDAAADSCRAHTAVADIPSDEEGFVAIIGEGVTSLAIASAIELEKGYNTKVLCATEPMGIDLRAKDRVTPDEDDIIPELAGAKAVIADPLYRPICPEEAKFVSLPSEAFSGRIYRDEIPDLVRDFGTLIERL